MKTYKTMYQSKNTNAVQLEESTLILDEVTPVVVDRQANTYIPDVLIFYLNNGQIVEFQGYGHYTYKPEDNTYVKVGTGQGVTYLNAELLASYMPVIDEIIAPDYYIKFQLAENIILEYEGPGRYFTSFNGATYILIRQHPDDYAHHEFSMADIAMMLSQAMSVTGPHSRL